MGLIIKFGVGNKNLKSVSESLDEVAHHISIKGVETLTEKDLKFVAKLADSADKGVRESSLVVLAEIYKVLDEGIWKIIGNVTPKVKGLLEARFKKTKGLSGSDSQVNLGLSMTSRTKAEFGLARSLVAGQVANQISTPRSLQFNKV